nr:MAG TPA: hypothetical protein [Caudoviricetes sp.]
MTFTESNILSNAVCACLCASDISPELLVFLIKSAIAFLLSVETTNALNAWARSSVSA